MNSLSLAYPQCFHSQLIKNSRFFKIYCAFRRPKPVKNPKSSHEKKVEMVIDVNDIANRASTSVKKFFRSSEAKFQRFLSSGSEAFSDLRNLIVVDSDKRIIVSCRPSSLNFLLNFFIWSCAFVILIRTLVKFGLLFGSGFGFGYKPVIRRDRSLGGREAIVGIRFKKDSRGFISPLSLNNETEKKRSTITVKSKVKKEETLPKWWPTSLPSPILMTGKEEFQREANRMIRAIMHGRMSGRDISEDDIIQLRRLCRDAGVKVTIDTANSRDSFFRAAIDFVLNICSSSPCEASLVQVDGENVLQFIAGIANNIGLEETVAIRMVCAAVAALTRSRFLQAWALEIQGKRSEVLEELLKICRIHQIFPPEESSPEMEMVARSLERNLKVQQREHLLKLLIGVCDTLNQKIAAEALGLVSQPSAENL